MARVTIAFTQTALPPVCVCCGEPATRVRRQEFRIDTALSAAVLVTSVALGALAWTERSLTLTLPVCDCHRRRGRRSTRTLLWGMLLTAGLGIAAYLGSNIDVMAGRSLGVAAMIAFMATLVVGMHEIDDGLKVKGLTADSVTLTGVHRSFAEAAGRALNEPMVGGPIGVDVPVCFPTASRRRS
jgi:hypothetical protein